MSREGAAVNKVLYDAALWREHDGWVTYKCNVEQMPRYAMLEAYGSPPIEKAIQAALDAAYAEGLREAATVWEWTSENPTKPGWYWMRRLDIKSQPCGICQIRCWPCLYCIVTLHPRVQQRAVFCHRNSIPHPHPLSHLYTQSSNGHRHPTALGCKDIVGYKIEVFWRMVLC